MYINTEYLESKSISLIDICILQLAKQQRSENQEAYLEKYEKDVEYLEKSGLLKTIKGKKKDSKMSKIRISKAGEEVLTNVEIPEANEDDITLFNWLKTKYLDMGKKLGNQKKTKIYIALFRAHSGIERNKLAFLMSTFLDDERNMEYNMVLEYALYKPQNAYNTKFNLEESRLYQYYLTHEEYFKENFAEIK